MQSIQSYLVLFNRIIEHFFFWSGIRRQLNTSNWLFFITIAVQHSVYTIISCPGFRFSCWIKCWTADNNARSARTRFTVNQKEGEKNKFKNCKRGFFLSRLADAVAHIAFFSLSDRLFCNNVSVIHYVTKRIHSIYFTLKMN